jgi:hypothetical protein
MVVRVLPFVFMLLCAGCIAFMPPPEPSRGVEFGQLLSEDTFESPGGWDEYDLQGAFLRVMDGAYHITAGLSQYVYGENRQTHDNVIIEVDAYLLSDYPKAIYGLMCRANAGQGYYFVISADGNFSIRRGAGSAVDALVAWQATGAVQKGSRSNQLRAVCAGEYLAFYVNGQFVGETTDGRYHQGAVGLTVALPLSANEGDTAEVVFDNVRVYAAP